MRILFTNLTTSHLNIANKSTLTLGNRIHVKIIWVIKKESFSEIERKGSHDFAT